MICCKVEKIIFRSCGNFYHEHAAVSQRILENWLDTLSDSVHHHLLMCVGSQPSTVTNCFQYSTPTKHTQLTNNCMRSRLHARFIEKHFMTVTINHYNFTIQSSAHHQSYNRHMQVLLYLVGNLSVPLCTHQRQCGYHFQTNMDLWKLTSMVGKGF